MNINTCNLVSLPFVVICDEVVILCSVFVVVVVGRVVVVIYCHHIIIFYAYQKKIQISIQTPIYTKYLINYKVKSGNLCSYANTGTLICKQYKQSSKILLASMLTLPI